MCILLCYLNTDRGSTGLGNGSLSGFLYLSEENFTAEVYTEICLTLAEKAPAYSEEYDDLISRYEDEVMAECEKQTAQRFRMTEAFIGMTPEIYILTRGENAGYVSFENDTSILSGVADIFPVFFILIAILVCITTMTRMVDEERTQIGVLKAMGYSRAAVTAKYLLYAGSATLIGWAVGFFPAGNLGNFPRVFWYAARQRSVRICAHVVSVPSVSGVSDAGRGSGGNSGKYLAFLPQRTVGSACGTHPAPFGERGKADSAEADCAAVEAAVFSAEGDAARCSATKNAS